MIYVYYGSTRLTRANARERKKDENLSSRYSLWLSVVSLAASSFPESSITRKWDEPMLRITTHYARPTEYCLLILRSYQVSSMPSSRWLRIL